MSKNKDTSGRFTKVAIVNPLDEKLVNPKFALFQFNMYKQGFSRP